MADAEIIPIGTRGRPGRGTGTRPSAAARGLAPKSGTRKPASSDEPKSPPADQPEAPSGEQASEETSPQAPRTAPAKKPAPRRPAPTKAAKPAPEPVIATPSLLDGLGQDVPSAVPAARTEERGLSPLAGIPVGDWLAAFQHAARELFGDQWEPQLARFLAFLRRRVTGDYAVDEYGFDAEVTERFFMAALRPIAQQWFRIEVRGVENIPAEGGALVVSNHSGTIPVDGLMTMVSIHDHAGRHLRPLGADLVFRLPVVGSLARKGGATLACSEDAERMLRGGELVGVWPEGFKGIGKPFSERYKLQRFGRGGFVSAALRTGVPIIPLSVVGAEEIYPLVGNIPSLARLLGVPYIPITPFFPLLGPLGLVPLPSKWLLEFGEPIRTDEYDAGAAEDPMLVFNVTDQVRETIQQTLYSLLMQRESVFK
ncbi:MAG TPA: 1-acyl-sn-glycerol-3-phosphate acyltransferase [Nocardioides sp.]|nr:1-acyl-sn-glycerol-3-phosphate acyltransferase [Nocardioides sp.]